MFFAMQLCYNADSKNLYGGDPYRCDNLLRGHGDVLGDRCLRLCTHQVKGRQFWFVLMIITMMLPSFFGSGFNIFLIMQFVRGIPRDISTDNRCCKRVHQK